MFERVVDDRIFPSRDLVSFSFRAVVSTARYVFVGARFFFCRYIDEYWDLLVLFYLLVVRRFVLVVGLLVSVRFFVVYGRFLGLLWCFLHFFRVNCDGVMVCVAWFSRGSVCAYVDHDLDFFRRFRYLEGVVLFGVVFYGFDVEE